MARRRLPRFTKGLIRIGLVVLVVDPGSTSAARKKDKPKAGGRPAESSELVEQVSADVMQLGTRLSRAATAYDRAMWALVLLLNAAATVSVAAAASKSSTNTSATPLEALLRLLIRSFLDVLRPILTAGDESRQFAGRRRSLGS